MSTYVVVRRVVQEQLNNIFTSGHMFLSIITIFENLPAIMVNVIKDDTCILAVSDKLSSRLHKSAVSSTGTTRCLLMVSSEHD